MMTRRFLTTAWIFIHLIACNDKKETKATNTEKDVDTLVAGLPQITPETNRILTTTQDTRLNISKTAILTITPPLSTLTLHKTPPAKEQAIHPARNNLLATAADADPYYPLHNIEPLHINYMVLGPDHEKFYLHVTKAKDTHTLSHPLSNKIEFSEAAALSWKTPLIGPAFDINFPLTLKQLKNTYGDSSYYLYDYTPTTQQTCENGSYLTQLPDSPDNAQVCLHSISIKTAAGIASHKKAAHLFDELQHFINEKLFFCSLLAFHRPTNGLSCLAGSHRVDAKIRIAEINIPIQIRIPLIEPETTQFDAFDKVKKGLKPLQFDDLGNRYISTHNFTHHHSILNKIDAQGNMSSITPSREDIFDSYVIFPDGNFAYSFRAIKDDGNIDKGIKFYQNGALFPVPASSRYAQSYQADDFSTLLVIDGYLLKAFSGGVVQSALTWQGRQASKTIKADNRILGCVNDKRVQIVPFNEEPLSENSCEAGDRNRSSAHPLFIPADNSVVDTLYLPPLPNSTMLNAVSGFSWLINTSEHSQIGMIFSQPVNSRTIMSALNVTQDNQTLNFIPFWYQNKLSLFPTDKTETALNRKIGALPPTYFKPQKKYQISLEPIDDFTYKSTQHKEKIYKNVSFLPYNGFTRKSSLTYNPTVTQKNYTAQLKAAPRAQDETSFPPSGDAFGEWGAYGTKGSEDVFRYFSVATFTHSQQVYQLTFDLLNHDDKHRWGIGASLAGAQLFTDDNTYSSSPLWRWNIPPNENPIDLTLSSINAPLFGFSLYKKNAYQNPSNAVVFHPLLDNSDLNKKIHWQRFQLTITSERVNLAIENAEGKFEPIGSQPLSSKQPEDGDMKLWLALPHYENHEIDNISFVSFKENNAGERTNQKTLLFSDFEDKTTAFDKLEGLIQPATQDITPLEL